MNSLNLQSNTVKVFYCIHKRNDSYLQRKEDIQKMIKWFFSKHQDLKGLIISKNKFGKPVLSNPNINISISNSNKITVYAISRLAIGIDLEFNRSVQTSCFEFINKLYGKYFTVNDLVGWVKLESMLKLRNLKLESEGKGEIKENLLFENIEHLELKINSKYISYLSVNQEITIKTMCLLYKYKK
jgi:hypothetical protein